MNQQQERYHAQGLLIHLGFMFPPNYKEVLAQDAERTGAYILSPSAITSRYGRKLMRGAAACIKAGLNDADIYHTLKKRGFLEKKTELKHNEFSRTTCARYITAQRNVLGIQRVTQSRLIIELFKQGKNEKEICAHAHVKLPYVRTVLTENGLVDKAAYKDMRRMPRKHQYIKIAKRKGVKNGKCK